MSVGNLVYAQQVNESDQAIVLPVPPATTYVVNPGENITYLSRKSVTLGFGVHIKSGATFRAYVSKVAKNNPSLDLNKNWVLSKVYDGDGDVIAESKQFFDYLGRPTQGQVKNLTERHVFAYQQLYDNLGKSVIRTLPAPINNQAFNYREGFVQDNGGQDYGVDDFDTPATLNNPNPVGDVEVGSLGWYYSANNDLDPYVAVTDFPYSRSWIEETADPRLVKEAGAGDTHKMGSNHEGQSQKLNLAPTELDHYFSLRHHFVEENTTLTKDKGYKVIDKDPNGSESVSYFDGNGNLVVTALKTGVTESYQTYLYYDDVGNLVAEVAPEGVNTGSSAYPNFVTLYNYNQLGWLLSATSTDEGTTEFVYSKEGQLRFSQNQEQRTANPKRFSYTLYALGGELIESGEYTQSGSGNYFFESHPNATSNVKSIHALVDNFGTSGALDAGRTGDVTRISYDLPAADYPSDALHPQQLFLVGNVSRTENENTTTWYCYDEFGRVVWMKQDIIGLGIKTVDYTYDFNDNVLEMAYQKGSSDAYYHHYSYDTDQRLHQVHTSFDGTNKTLQATYYYYLHGALKRVELAGDLQGIDYLYTIEGALKAINHPDVVKDPGGDGPNGFMADAFGMTLEYYDNDYQGVNFNVGNTAFGGLANRYAGNIKAVNWRSPVDGQMHSYAYDYDERYQLHEAKWGDLNKTGNNYTFSQHIGNGYKVDVPVYDNNGNIKNLQRRDESGTLIADYTYDYINNTNQLDQVQQNGQTEMDYSYNAIGQMIHQQDADGALYLDYNVSGLVRAVYADAAKTQPVVKFNYDDRGFRVLKISYDANHQEATKTWYVRDIGGILLSTYSEDVANGGPIELTEVPIYGNTRIGVYKPAVLTAYYELKDHLGNVRVVIGQPESVSYTATMETTPSTLATTEEQEFANVSETRHLDLLYNHTSSTAETPNPTYSARLNGLPATGTATITGPAILLPVVPGDEVDVEVFAKYSAGAGTYSNIATGLVASLADAFADASGIGMSQEITDLFDGIFGGATPLVNVDDSDDDNVPKAYLNYIVFDKNLVFQRFGFSQVSAAGNGAHEGLRISTGDITTPGFVYVYVSNETNANLNVFFDDLRVTHQYAPIAISMDYYPFGLPMEARSYAREDYRFGYQGEFAEKDEETGWNAFQLRMYDPKIGRWLSPDPYGEFHSPYLAMGNNPGQYDPTGGLTGTDPILKALKEAGVIILDEVIITPSTYAGLGGVISTFGVQNADGLRINRENNIVQGYLGDPSSTGFTPPDFITKRPAQNPIHYQGSTPGSFDLGSLATLDNFQTVVDFAGWIPGVQTVSGIVSAGIDFYKGNYLAAGISLLAAVPLVGYIAKGAKLVKTFQKHHIIPNQIYRELGLKKFSWWKQSHGLNLKKLPVPFHGNHPSYNNYVRLRIEELGPLNFDKLKKLQHELRQEINHVYLSKEYKRLNEYYKELGF